MPSAPDSLNDRFHDWLTGYGWRFSIYFGLVAVALIVMGKIDSIGVGAFGAAAIALRRRGEDTRRNPLWRLVGIPAFVFFVASWLVILWRVI